MLCAPSLSSPLTGGEQLRFKGRKKGQSFLGTAIVVQFGKFFPAKWAQAATATVDEEMTITYSDLVHSVVALLHDNYLPHLAPHQIFQQLCHEGTRTLVVLRDPEETQRDVLNSKSSSARLEFNNNTDTIVMSRFGGSAKPWQKIVPSLSGGSDGNGLSAASVSSPEEENEPDRVVGVEQTGSAATTSDATQSPLDNRQWVSWASMNRRNKEEILNECGSICSDHLYSDVCGDDSSDDDESIADDEFETNDCGQMFTKSLEAYLRAVQHRKRERQVGVESRLVACASFCKEYRPSGAKVVVLSNIVVRKKFRRYGIGSFMVKRIKSPSLVGPYDAMTMHIRCGEQCAEAAGNGAAKPAHNQHSNCVSSTKQRAFFEKNSFTPDIILNSRFHEEDGNVRTGEVLMCFLPPFESGPYHNTQNLNMNCANTQANGQQATGQMAQHNSIKAMQEEAQRWKEKSLEAYQVQMSYMARLQQEVLRLHEQLNKQEFTIDQLRKENSRLQTRLVKAEKKTARALIETLDKEAADFERMCVSRKLSSDVPFNPQSPLSTRPAIRS